MSTGQTGNGLLSRLKNVFSSRNEENHLEVSTIETAFADDELNNNEFEKPTEDVLGPISTTSPYYNNNSESVSEKEITLRTVEVTAPTYTPSLPVEKDLDIRFATKFIQAGGRFIFCESLKGAVEGIQQLKEENGWSHVFCWENEIKDSFTNNNFQKGVLGFTIENSDAAVSLCETLIADEGTIILNPKQASRRRLSCFPRTHIILTDLAHIVGNEADGLDRFNQLHKGELPSIIKLGACNNGHFYDKQRLILNAEGTEDVYVFLVDELIPPSLRP